MCWVDDENVDSIGEDVENYDMNIDDDDVDMMKISVRRHQLHIPHIGGV